MKFEIAPKETEIRATWNDATLYCFFLNIDGKTGWRLPTKEEFNQIYESENDFCVDGNYWSSTEFDTGRAWVQCFGFGGEYPCDKNLTNPVRAIWSLA